MPTRINRKSIVFPRFVQGAKQLASEKYQFTTVWHRGEVKLRESATQFLVREARLSLSDAMERSRELLMVAYAPPSNIAATCTAFPVLVESLGVKCFYYRTFVGHRHRAHGLRSARLAYQLLLRSYRLLNERFVAGCDQDVVGIYLEIENPKIQRILDDAVWQSEGVRFTYIGKTSVRGKHCRIGYFDGARISR